MVTRGEIQNKDMYNTHGKTTKTQKIPRLEYFFLIIKNVQNYNMGSKVDAHKN